jgi:hypothetical protein
MTVPLALKPAAKGFSQGFESRGRDAASQGLTAAA